MMWFPLEAMLASARVQPGKRRFFRSHLPLDALPPGWDEDIRAYYLHWLEHDDGLDIEEFGPPAGAPG